MTTFTPEMMEKAKQVQTPGELKALLKQIGVELTEEEANVYYAYLNGQAGELTDDDLDNVSGGGCDVSTGGKERVVVSSGLACFTGKFECAYDMVYYNNNHEHTNKCECSCDLIWKRTDNLSLRKMWESFSCVRSNGGENCGRCIHLEFKGGTGYCGVS